MMAKKVTHVNFGGAQWFIGYGSQAEMKEQALVRGHQCELVSHRPLTAREIKEGRKGTNRYGSYTDWDAAWKALKISTPKCVSNHLYELIPEGRPCKPYLDIDLKALPADVPTDDAFLDLITAAVTKVFADDYEIALVVWLYPYHGFL
ncbi:hypothetical protein HKX48_007644 [Thoreauomyces humboldtii]|nr:hypothetical protein HKX48_007644 [Thoreauomyces humboldtii]